jgi:pyrimidine deaminase RibD-like protein
MASDMQVHNDFILRALEEAKKSPPKPSNFCVGALIVDAATNSVLASGYTLELPGNTHAEQVCLLKLAEAHSIPEERVGEILPPNTVLYTTMEPCGMRLSGNLPCAERIVRTRKPNGELAIKKVYQGVKEPETFVGENEARKRLESEGVECIHVAGFEEDILKVATAGHGK